MGQVFLAGQESELSVQREIQLCGWTSTRPQAHLAVLEPRWQNGHFVIFSMLSGKHVCFAEFEASRAFPI